MVFITFRFALIIVRISVSSMGEVGTSGVTYRLAGLQVRTFFTSAFGP